MSALALIAKVQRLQKLQSSLAKARIATAEKAKRPATKTVDQLIKRYGNDFNGFCDILDIVPNEGERRPLTPLMSTQVLRNASRTARDIVLKPRRVGITSLEIARDIWFFLTRPGAQVAVVCQSVSDHGPLNNLSRMIRVMFESIARAGFDLRFSKSAVHQWQVQGREAVLTIIEAGASEAAAQKKGRGSAIHRLHITETAFFEYAYESLNAIIDCVPHVRFGSEIVSESTANGAAGYFFEKYRESVEGKSGFSSLFLRWFDNDIYRSELAEGEVIAPTNDREARWMADGVTGEQIKWYREKLAEKGRQDQVDQEYPSDPETCFLVSGRTFFDQQRTNELHVKTKDPILVEKGGALRIWALPVAGRKYTIGVDPSEGMGGDPGAAVVCDRASGEHVATLHGQFTPYQLAHAVTAIGLRYNRALVVVERNNHGHAVLEKLAEIEIPTGRGDEKTYGYPNLYRDDADKPGWNSTEVSRCAALDALEDAHRTGEWSTPDKAVTGELLTFVVDKKGKAQAAAGAHDDLVIAMAVVWTTISKVSTALYVPTVTSSSSRWGSARGRGF